MGIEYMNDKLYTTLFKLRQIIEVPAPNCRTLQYALNLNVIDNINTLMAQLDESQNLREIEIIFDTTTIQIQPSLKEIVDVKNHIFYFSSFLSEFSQYDDNFHIITKTLNDIVLFIDTHYLKKD